MTAGRVVRCPDARRVAGKVARLIPEISSPPKPSANRSRRNALRPKGLDERVRRVNTDEHEHEQEQHHHGAGVDDHLDDTQEDTALA